MPAQDIIVIGGSAGGLEALTTVLSDLPADLNASLFVVLHTSPQSGEGLPQVLERSCLMPVAFATDAQRVQRGHVYVAPPDHHLTLADGELAVARGPRENGFRPAIDPLFRSAAKWHGSRVVGVILSGAMDDGTFGMMAVKEAGGTAIVQHPYEAFVPSMPLSAIQNVEVDYIVRTAEIPQLLVKATEGEFKVSGRASLRRERVTADIDPTERDIDLSGVVPDEIPQPPSKLVCPDCGGSLWEVAEGGLTRYRCHTGHGYTSATLLAAQSGNLEHALWGAIRVLSERATLHRQLSRRNAARGMTSSAEKYRERAIQEERHANVIHEMLNKAPLATEPMPPEADQTV